MGNIKIEQHKTTKNFVLILKLYSISLNAWQLQQNIKISVNYTNLAKNK